MKVHFVGIVVLAVLMLTLPLQLRFSQDNLTLPGSDVYYHARIAQELSTTFFTKDNAVAHSRQYSLNPYHLVLAGAYKLFGTRVFYVLPALFAGLGFVAFWILLRKLNISQNTQFWILLVYVLSPPFISLSFLGTPDAFLVFLLLAGSALMFGRGWPGGIALFVVAAWGGLAAILAGSALLLVLIFLKKGNIQAEGIALFLVLFTFVSNLYAHAIPVEQSVVQYVSDLGGLYGLSIFALLLAIVGGFVMWEHKRKYYGAYATVIVFIVLCIFFPELLVFENVLITTLAGIALAMLASRAWKLKFIRNASLLVIFCGLLFSGISHAVSLASMPPTQTFLNVLDKVQGRVLTHESYGFLVESKGAVALSDPLLNQNFNANEIRRDIVDLFKSTDLERTRALLKEYEVDYVLITPQMQKGLVWDRENEGLGFLIRNNETFKRIDTGSAIGLWKVS